LDIPYIFAALFASLIWGIFTLISLAGQMFAAQSERAGRLVVIFFLWCTVLSMIGVASIPFVALQFGAPDSAMQFVIANTLSVAVVSSAVYAVYGKYLSLSAGGTRLFKGRRGRTTSTVGMTGVTLLIFSMGNYYSTSFWMPAPRSGAMAVCAATFVFGIVVIRFQRRFLGVGGKGTPFPLEESPLTDELHAIAAAFGADGTKLRVVPTKSSGDSVVELTPTQISSVVQSWMFRPRRRPQIPIELFQRLDPNELTAILALRYSIGMPAEMTGHWWRALLLVLITFGIIFTFLPVTILFLEHFKPHPAIKAVTCAVSFYSGLFLFFKAMRLVGFARNPPMFWVDAFAAWKAAAPDDESRDFVDFTYALLGYDSLLHAIPRDQKLITLLGKNVYIIKAAKIVAGMEREEYLAAVGARVAAGGGHSDTPRHDGAPV
jgi:hypothetical protein